MQALGRLDAVPDHKERRQMSGIDSDKVTPTGEVLRVLVAENGHFNQRVATSLLKKLGHSSTVVEDGAAVVAELTKADFDIALLDVELLDETTARQIADLRSAKQAAGHPLKVIALGAEASGSESAIVDQTVARPLRAADLSSAFRRVPQGAESSVVDWDQALERVEGRASLLDELTEIFLAEHPKIMAKIDQAIGSQDAKNLQVHAHGMKGCLRYFGPTEAAELAAQLEAMGKSGQTEDAVPVHAALTDQLNQLVPELQRHLSESRTAPG